MMENIEPSRVIEKTIGFDDLLNKQSDAHQEYVRNWETDVRGVFENNLNEIIERKKSWQSHGEGFGIDGTVLGEMLHHSQWAAEKVKSFYGRDDPLKRAIDTINSEVRPIREGNKGCLLYTSPSPRDRQKSRMPSSA